MESLFDESQLRILAGLLILLGAMLWYIYAPQRDDRSIRIPRELISRDNNVEDPFRDPSVMNDRLDDLGRHSIRANQGDGV